MVYGSRSAGGFAGAPAGETRISRCSADVDVFAPEFAAGFSGGGYYRVIITDAYATGAVDAARAAGFASGSHGRFARCYASGAISGTTRAGFAFLSDAAPGDTENADSFWNTETSGVAFDGGGPMSPNATGITTAQMQSAATFAAWDFTAVWQLAPGGFPTLR